MGGSLRSRISARMDPTIRQRLRVVFVGGTPRRAHEYDAALRATVVRERLGNCVTFMGERSDVPDLMNAADVVPQAARASVTANSARTFSFIDTRTVTRQQ